MPAPASATRMGVERAVMGSSSEAEEAHGIVPKHAIEIAGLIEPALDRFERRRVAYGSGHVDERPVGAPDAILDPECLDHGPRKGLEIAVTPGLIRNPKRRRELDGGIAR